MNWSEIVIEIISHGMSEKKIADECGVSQPTIHRIKSGQNKDPRRSLTDKLMALHKQKLKQAPKPRHSANNIP